jgi:hypothetical protein
MKVIIEIRTDNAAFAAGGEGVELARILHKLAERYEIQEKLVRGESRKLLDVNGNVVGGVRHSTR